ncbi:hypothetical protein ACJJTC_014689 [Scirpophaga incertulas]
MESNVKPIDRSNNEKPRKIVPTPDKWRRAIAKKSRPEKGFVECSYRSKRRKTQELRSNNETVELTYAAEMKLRSEGNVHAAKVLADIIKNSDASNYIEKDSDRKIAKLTENKALSLLINARLTKYQYNIIRSNALEENCETPHHETNTSNHNVNIAEQLEICQNTITMETVLCDGDITICEELGEPESRLANICKQPLNVGHCRLYYERWFFDYTTKFCEPFTYSGCGGNENNFPNRTECVKYCTVN